MIRAVVRSILYTVIRSYVPRTYQPEPCQACGERAAEFCDLCAPCEEEEWALCNQATRWGDETMHQWGDETLARLRAAHGLGGR